MNTKFDHNDVEKGKEKKWRDKKFFSTHDESKKPFSILLPPPNVTGKLHIGHAWDAAIQDSLIRYNKLQNKDVMWIVGMDHAGIATQAKVEARLNEEGKSRNDIGRDGFISKALEWKAEYANTIRKQWETIGLALDYDNERFTLDDHASATVQKVFVDLYNRNLIYRGKRAVNWDPKLQTVLSNIEVENKDTLQSMYYINYDLKEGGTIQIATTRVETIFSDVAIAINPNDNKMKSFLGKTAINPLSGTECPIIEDNHIEIGKGTGAMKVSAHAEADFEILVKNKLPINECIDKSGKMNDLAMEFKGMDRFEARKEIAKKLSKEKRITKIEEVTSAVGYSERSGEPIEILVSPQWFVDMKPMSEKIINDLSTDKKVNFIPQRFEATLRTWMDDIKDWCISRQLWWGHRIPAWYKENEIKVQIESPGSGWIQDDDVLDTWFSSGIAPFMFLGWPEKTQLLKRFYPTDVLVTGYDIIFFWVARMYFQSLDIMNEKPFNDVLIHGLIRAEDGKKMSKSLGNGIDPMLVIKKYGSDALRWFLLTNSSPGQDIRYSTEKLEASWNLNNKLWNISRYILDVMPESSGQLSPADKWIESKITNLSKTIKSKMKQYEFTIIGKELTKFIVEDFSSWYIEMSKEQPNKTFAKKILSKLMLILHPFMPFITDHIYGLTNDKELLDEIWPSGELSETKDIDQAIEIVKILRKFRVDHELSNKVEVKYEFSKPLSSLEIQIINKLAIAEQEDNNDAIIPLGNDKLFIKLSSEAKSKQNEAEQKHIKFLESEIKRANEILSNEKFISKAPPTKIEDEKAKLKKYQAELNSLRSK